MMNNKYRVLSKYVLRTPILSLDSYKNLTSKPHISDEEILNVFENDIIKESLFIASPSLYKSLMMWKKNELSDVKVKKIKLTLLKYITRMSTRPTPFGIFAGCSVGSMGNKDNILLNKCETHKKCTRLDMNYLVNLARTLSELPFIKKQLKYFNNTSLYNIGDSLRYIEYQYIKNNRKYKISSIETSKFLDLILKKSKKGIILDDIIKLLSPYGFSDDDINEFINDLIYNQIIVSELEPSVTGKDVLSQIIDVLNKLKKVDELLLFFKEIQEKISEIDNLIGTNIENYTHLISYLSNLKIEFDTKYQFQTDLKITTVTNELDKSIEKTILKGLNIFNKLSKKTERKNLNDFKEAFSKRYDEKRKMDLSYILDPELSIGYVKSQFIGIGDDNPLVDDLILDSKSIERQEIKWSEIENFFNEKLTLALLKNESTITIKQEELVKIKPSLGELNDTFSAIVEIYNINGELKLYIKSFDHSSGANLISRFAFADDEIMQMIKEITLIEEKNNPDKILAEIVHLPEDRVGNIIMRPSFRKYEIPFLSKSNLNIKNQISINDLNVHIENQKRIVLTSKQHQKEIKTYLSNAHNYTYNSLPIYHFLCDIQNQDIKNINFNVFPISYKHIPRIMFENIILQKAKWIISSTDIKIFNDYLKGENIIELFDEYRNKRNMPEQMCLVQGENELLINFKNITCIEMFLTSIKEKKEYELVEFLFSSGKQLVKNIEGDFFSNQLIFTLYKKN